MSFELLLPLSGLWGLAGLFAAFLRGKAGLTCQSSVSATLLLAALEKAGRGISLIGVEAGFCPVILSLGYGGRTTKPLWVDPQIHESSICGDEPLMLAEGRDVGFTRPGGWCRRHIGAWPA